MSKHLDVRPSRRTVWSRVRRFLWRFVRALVIGGAALGPGTPPPPPPPPPQIEQRDDDGADHDADGTR